MVKKDLCKTYNGKVEAIRYKHISKPEWHVIEIMYLKLESSSKGLIKLRAILMCY